LASRSCILGLEPLLEGFGLLQVAADFGAQISHTWTVLCQLWHDFKQILQTAAILLIGLFKTPLVF
jgi:hypothetical protein